MVRPLPTNPEAVLFDLDGTLANTLPLFVRAYSLSAKEVGLRIPDREIPSRCFGKTEEEICSSFSRPELAGEFRRAYFREIRRMVIPLSRPCPGAKETLSFLKENGAGLAVVSFAYGWYAGRVLKNCGLSGYFPKKLVLTREAVKRQKPFPDQALLACNILGAKPGLTAVVGDSQSDVGMANSAGCASVLYRPDGYSRYFKQPRKIQKFVHSARIKSLISLKKILRFSA